MSNEKSTYFILEKLQICGIIFSPVVFIQRKIIELKRKLEGKFDEYGFVNKRYHQLFCEVIISINGIHNSKEIDGFV